MSLAFPAGGRRWTAEEIGADAALAVAEFRSRRLAEPLHRYLAVFHAHEAEVRSLVEDLDRVLTDADATTLGALWASDEGRSAFRYLGAPPISSDDLETLAEAPLSSASAMESSGDKRGRLIGVLRAVLDPRRFPWIESARTPTRGELEAAVLATTALVASQRVQTLRRGDEKSSIEGAVRGLLVGMGWQAGQSRGARGIQNLLNDSPAEKTFLTQVNLGKDNADVVVRLGNGHLLAIECKGSNSAINSRKRLNKEAVQNAQGWLEKYGGEVIPAVALQGVFNPRYVLAAQDTPMLIFWAHRLDDLVAFVNASQ